MNYFELKSFIKWMKQIKVTSLKEFGVLKEKYDLNSKSKILNFANGCAVYGLTFEDLK